MMLSRVCALVTLSLVSYSFGRVSDHKISEDVKSRPDEKAFKQYINPFDDGRKKRSLPASRGESNLFQCVQNTPEISKLFLDKVELDDLSPIEDHLESYCPGYPNVNILDCEFPKSLAFELGYTKSCRDVGGKIFSIKMDMCTSPTYPQAKPVSVNTTPFGKIGNDKESKQLYFDEVHYKNYPVCAHSTCTTKMVTTLYNSGYKNDRWDCSKDSLDHVKRKSNKNVL